MGEIGARKWDKANGSQAVDNASVLYRTTAPIGPIVLDSSNMCRRSVFRPKASSTVPAEAIGTHIVPLARAYRKYTP